ncbi:MBL fold metallo-hydrolase [Cytobacillus purgationiresistens]|uniref:Glyoxylase-like metal-dependent hydrolase (Beta-lactamase superfamily II) n=1 Tax=Cytobacillus purgationiresistens TaxID=863449 RepID=A0ABU0AR69_9BACI|nr:MBL fold metallo-hydrolase [Cytobacillus purgationiresistens]MDQ0273776.1 glyoxylase-like metal-dependent hydrolase (beta-lactamase superfamily II) [Cytobacillus purgationiresistens]
MQGVTELGNDIYLIDLMDMGIQERTGAYVIKADELTIVETSASPSIPHLLAGLKELGLDPADVKHLIVTHVHLDHAGGAGLFLEHCPEATVYVHPRGKRHLADPSKLIMGARAVYGEKFDQLFDPILPIPDVRLVEMEEDRTLKIGDRILTFMDTPGHAKHHFSIHDSGSNGVFTGDTIGVLYPQLAREGVELSLPSTSPNQFSPEDMLASATKIESLNPERIYFGHYGMSASPVQVFAQLRYWLPIFIEESERVWKANHGVESAEIAEQIKSALFAKVQAYLETRGVKLDNEVYEIIQLDLNVGSMGMIDRMEKLAKQ